MQEIFYGPTAVIFQVSNMATVLKSERRLKRTDEVIYRPLSTTFRNN